MVLSIGIYEDAAGTTPSALVTSTNADAGELFSEVWNFEISNIAQPISVRTLYMIAKTRSGSRATKKIELLVCPANMLANFKASGDPAMDGMHRPFTMPPLRV